MAGVEILTADEMRLLLARPNVRYPTGLRNRVILEVLYRCGLRASEVSLLELADVRWKDETLRIRAEVQKGGHRLAGTDAGRKTVAVLDLEPETLQWIGRWRDVRRTYARKTHTPLLFCTLTGRMVWRQYIWEMVSRSAQKAGIDHPVWPHMLRHTYATELLVEGMNIRQVQTLMRHSDVRTTEIYTHVNAAVLRERVRARRAS